MRLGVLACVVSSLALAGEGSRSQAAVYEGLDSELDAAQVEKVSSSDPQCVSVERRGGALTLRGGKAGCHAVIRLRSADATLVYEVTVRPAPKAPATDRLIAHAESVVEFAMKAGSAKSSDERIAYVFVMPHPEDPPTLIQTGKPGTAFIDFTSRSGEPRRLELLVIAPKR